VAPHSYKRLFSAKCESDKEPAAANSVQGLLQQYLVEIATVAATKNNLKPDIRSGLFAVCCLKR
jgi:hypothetical protein